MIDKSKEQRLWYCEKDEVWTRNGTQCPMCGLNDPVQQAIAQERERIASQIYRLYPPTFIEGGLVVSGKQEATHIRRLTTDEAGVLTNVLHIITNNHER